jgi:hypothetical protein
MQNFEIGYNLRIMKLHFTPQISFILLMPTLRLISNKVSRTIQSIFYKLKHEINPLLCAIY